jgi:MscS family membrane protein
MLLLVSGVTWLLYILIDSAHDMLAKITTKTESNLDDMVLGLMTGVTKLLLFLAAAIVTADIFGLPYGTVVAGIGVSGLAFAIASRDLIANLFGSAIIASDRPFQRGDFISVGDTLGTVEHVGLRSTRVRPLDDSAVIIPNSVITTDRVVNISKRRKIRVVETVHISHDSSIEAIQALRDKVREELLADEMVAEEGVRMGLSTVSLYAVDMQAAFYIKTTNYDEFLMEKHRILSKLLATIEAAGVERAVLRRE